MMHYWEQPIAPRKASVAECETCEGNIIVLLTPIMTEEEVVGLAVHCSQCLTMLNHQETVNVEEMADDELFQTTGCKMLPHWNRYNIKVHPRMSSLMEMRWRHV